VRAKEISAAVLLPFHARRDPLVWMILKMTVILSKVV
jgi:hypothetical protein